MDANSSTHQPEWIVEWADEDPEDPRQFSTVRKVWISFLLFMFALVASAFGGSIVAPATDDIANDFHISREVAVLSVTLFLLGNVFGSWAWVRTPLPRSVLVR